MTATSCRDIGYTHLISVVKKQGTVGIFVQEITTAIISRIVEFRQALILHVLCIGSNQMFDLDVREKPWDRVKSLPEHSRERSNKINPHMK